MSQGNTTDPRKQMIQRLKSLGGYVWETPRLNNGAPTLHFVWDGQYYGFYTTTGLKNFERTAMEQLKKSGAICAIATKVNTMEEAMNLDISERELKRLLPTRSLIQILRKWGDGCPVDRGVEAAILSLPPDYKNAIYALYFDKYTLNRYAEEYEIQYGNATMRHQRALRMLREKLVKKHDVVADHVLR